MTHAISLALLHFLWQGALVALLLWITLSWFRITSANLRYALNCAALALLSALPVITTYVIYDGATAPAQKVTISPAAIPAIAIAAAPMTERATGSLARGLTDWALPIWAAGVLLFSLRMIWGFTQVATLRKSGKPAASEIIDRIKLLCDRLGVRQQVGILICSVSNCPSVIGWLRPVILLPTSALTGLSPDQLEAVLAHELAHVRRHDYLVNILQMTVETLLFYHPAVWWVSKRIRHERELCCDDVAVSACQDAICYARALTALERMRHASPAMAMGSTDGPLLYRVRRIVGDTGVERGAPRRTGSLAVSLGLLCIAISMGLLRGQAADSSTAILVHAPGVVNQTGIEYPAAARTAGDEGFVAIECTLDAQGNVVEATLLPSTTEWPRYHDAPLVLQNSVLEAVRKWKFASGSKTVVGVMFQADSRSVDSFIQAGDFLYRNGQVDEAFRKFAEAAAQHPEKKITFQKRQIEVLIRQGKTADALNKDLKILQEDPNDAEARAMQASYRLDKGDVESAIKELWDVMDDIPDNFVAHFNLGRAYSRKGDLEQAEVQFRAALRIKPDYRIAKLGLVELSLRKGDYGAAFNGQLFFGHKAREIAQEILKKDPQNADALQLLAMCDEMKY